LSGNHGNKSGQAFSSQSPALQMGLSCVCTKTSNPIKGVAKLFAACLRKQPQQMASAPWLRVANRGARAELRSYWLRATLLVSIGLWLVYDNPQAIRHNFDFSQSIFNDGNSHSLQILVSGKR